MSFLITNPMINRTQFRPKVRLSRFFHWTTESPLFLTQRVIDLSNYSRLHKNYTYRHAEARIKRIIQVQVMMTNNINITGSEQHSLYFTIDPTPYRNEQWQSLHRDHRVIRVRFTFESGKNPLLDFLALKNLKRHRKY